MAIPRNVLKLFRGAKATMPALQDGEPGYATDEKELYVGTSTDGNVKLTSKKEIQEINSQLAEIVTYINIRKYGAKTITEDVNYDCVTALTNAINEANLLNGTIIIRIPRGNWFFGNGADVPDITKDNVHIVGDGIEITKINLTSGNYFTWHSPDGYITRGGLSKMSIIYESADTFNPTCKLLQSAEQIYEDLKLFGVATFLEVGSPDMPSYNVTFREIRASIANSGNPMVKLVRGAGFYWTDFGHIGVLDSIVPTWDTTSVMNTKPGTNVIDVVGGWDTIDLCLFAEKTYNVISINLEAGSLVFNLKIHDSVFDYIRNSIIYTTLNGSTSSLSSLSVNNVYCATWEGHAFHFQIGLADCRNVTFSNVYTIFSGKAAIWSQGVLKNYIITGCRFTGTSRYDNSFNAIHIDGSQDGVISGNRIGGSDVSSNITWGADVGLKLNVFYKSNTVTGNASEQFVFPVQYTPTVEYIKPKNRIHGNNYIGTAGVNYAGKKINAPFVRPLTDTDWYNVSPYNIIVYVGGTSITQLKYNGDIMPFTNGQLKLFPGNYYQITYTDTNYAKVIYYVEQ
jgi:hypothetical protein